MKLLSSFHGRTYISIDQRRQLNQAVESNTAYNDKNEC